MSRRKSVRKQETGAQRIIGLSETDFEEWMDSVEQAGLRLRTK